MDICQFVSNTITSSINIKVVVNQLAIAAASEEIFRKCHYKCSHRSHTQSGANATIVLTKTFYMCNQINYTQFGAHLQRDSNRIVISDHTITILWRIYMCVSRFIRTQYPIHRELQMCTVVFPNSIYIYNIFLYILLSFFIFTLTRNGEQREIWSVGFACSPHTIDSRYELSTCTYGNDTVSLQISRSPCCTARTFLIYGYILCVAYMYIIRSYESDDDSYFIYILLCVYILTRVINIDAAFILNFGYILNFVQ